MFFFSFFSFLFRFFFFFLLFSKFLFHLFGSVGPQDLVPLVGDARQLQLGAGRILLDGYGAVVVGPKLVDVAGPLELADLVEETIASPCEHEVEVQVSLLPLLARIFDLRDHLVKGRVEREVGQGELDTAIREVVTGLDLLFRQCHIAL